MVYNALSVYHTMVVKIQGAWYVKDGAVYSETNLVDSLGPNRVKNVLRYL